jgi:hypothetical protein
MICINDWFFTAFCLINDAFSLIIWPNFFVLNTSYVLEISRTISSAWTSAKQEISKLRFRMQTWIWSHRLSIGLEIHKSERKQALFRHHVHRKFNNAIVHLSVFRRWIKLCLQCLVLLRYKRRFNCKGLHVTGNCNVFFIIQSIV